MNNLKKLRLNRKLTQKMLACGCGLSQSYINELENGKKTNPSSAVLMKLARGLEVQLSELLDEKRLSGAPALYE